MNPLIINATDHGIFLGSMMQTHDLVFLLPKPNCDKILQMARLYYNAHASSYDTLDNQLERRHLTHIAIDRFIAAELQEMKRASLSVLSCACGTGRRELFIQEQMQSEVRIDGVDISEEMCRVASKKGVRAHCSTLHTMREVVIGPYDSVLYLDSFGALSSRSERLLVLREIAGLLRVGGTLYFDVPNFDDNYEWGPAVRESHKLFGLGAFGYEPGDFFFCRREEPNPCFWHYSTSMEVECLLSDAGLTVDTIRYIGYAHRSGELVGRNEGMIFVKAFKTN